MNRLPKLRILPVFVSVANHLSFSKAADELCVTHSAISQSIHQLEESLQLKLFERNKGKVTLTELGENYLNAIKPALATIQLATDDITRKTDERVLTINVSTTFAMRWLIPHMNDFQSENPDFELRLNTPTRSVNFSNENIDAAIYYMAHPSDELYSECLFTLKLTPVANRKLSKQLENMSIKKWFVHHKVIMVNDDEKIKEWALWFEAARVKQPKKSQILCFNSTPQALEAATQGLGITLSSTIFGDLAQRKLIAPLKLSVQSPRSYYFVCPRSNLNYKKLNVFLDWLRDRFSDMSHQNKADLYTNNNVSLFQLHCNYQ